MPKRSDAAEYVAPAIEVLPKPTCNMSSRPSLSTSCASLPGWTVRRWPRLVVPTSQPYNSRPDEFATSVNIDTGGEFKVQVSTLAPWLILEVQLQADVCKIWPCHSNHKRLSAFQTRRGV